MRTSSILFLVGLVLLFLLWPIGALLLAVATAMWLQEEFRRGRFAWLVNRMDKVPTVVLFGGAAAGAAVGALAICYTIIMMSG